MPSEAKVIGSPWSFTGVWNNTLDNLQDRPLVPRDYMYASELGGPFIDRYLKMYAVKYSNPPNYRSQRKFQAGNMWEWILKVVLRRAGLLRETQVACKFKIATKLIEVSGKKDFVAGGEIDWDKAKKEVADLQQIMKGIDLEIPPFFFLAAENIIKDLESNKILKLMILEAKSCSSFIMDKMEKTGEPQSNHVLQLYHYIIDPKSEIDEGKLSYICRDDCRTKEFSIVSNEVYHTAYKLDIAQATKNYRAGFNPKKPLELAPPKEKEIIFEEGVWRFGTNWKVEYSNYLTMLYGYETPEKYRMTWNYHVQSWNRAFKRAVNEGLPTGKLGRPLVLTDSNLKAISECKKHFPQFDKMVSKAKKAGAFGTEEDDE